MIIMLRRGLLVLVALSLASAFVSAAQAAAHEETSVLRFEAPEGRRLALENLAGSILIQPADGAALELEARTFAEADTAAQAASLARSVRLDVAEGDRQISVLARYPVEEHRVFIYQAEGIGRFSHRARYHDETVLLTSDPDRKGARVHTDFLLKLPPGVAVKIDNRAGSMEAADISADLYLASGYGSLDIANVTGKAMLDTGSAPVRVRDHRGSVVADTGSGAVLIEGLVGDASADTGSGRVTYRNVEGDVHADTGSGSVNLENVAAGRIHADTGSGSVFLENVTGSLHADTGSGSVRAENFFAGASVVVDTGSGSVSLSGNLAEVERLDIDTGSGGVQLATAQLPSLHLRAEAGSGSVDVDLPALSHVRADNDYFEADIGDGEGEGIINTGSGSIRMRMH